MKVLYVSSAINYITCIHTRAHDYMLDEECLSEWNLLFNKTRIIE